MRRNSRFGLNLRRELQQTLWGEGAFGLVVRRLAQYHHRGPFLDGSCLDLRLRISFTKDVLSFHPLLSRIFFFFAIACSRFGPY